ncbi:MAG: MMPL family transporter [Planctomycetaceae bacterium]|nr:MMPL family transporter [Planctomycetaceae bacterium]
MTHFFEKRDRWGNGLSLWVLLGCLFIAPLCAWSLRNTQVENDIENWLPDSNPNAVTLKWSMRLFGPDAGENLLVSWDDSSLSDPRLEKLAERLEGKPDEQGVRRGGLKQVARVVTPRDVLTRMVEHDVDRDEAIRRMQGVLVGTGALKVRLTDAGRQRQKEVQRELIAKAKQELGLELQILPAFQEFELQEDEPVAVETPTANANAVESSVPEQPTEAADVPDPIVFDPIPAHDFQVRWKGMLFGATNPKLRELALSLKGSPTSTASDGMPLVEDCFQVLGSPVAMSVTLSEAGEAEKANAMKLVREAAIAVGVKPEQLHLGGRPVAATALNESVKAAVWNKSAKLSRFWERSTIGMSGLVGVLVAFTMLRSVKLSLLVLFVSYFTVFVTLALVPATGGSMNMVMVLMPTFLLVVVMSGAIHVAHYWRHSAYRDMSSADVESSKMAAEPCAIATITTAIGVLSLLTSELRPVREFGIYSAIGALIGLGAVLYLLPTLIQLIPFKPPKPQEVDATKWENFGRWCCHKRHWIVWGYTAATLVCCIGLTRFQTETKVIRYFPPDAPVVKDYWFLEENIVGIVPVDLIIRFDRDSQSQLNILERMEVVRLIENRMREHAEISGAVALPDFRPISQKPATDAGLGTKLAYNRKATETQRRLREGEVVGTKPFYSLAKQSGDLSQPGDAKLNQPDDELWRITAQCFIMTDTNFADLIKDVDGIARSVLRMHAGTQHVVTGMVPVFMQTQRALLDSQVNSFGVAYLTVAIVMIVTFRSILAGFLTMLPNVYPIGQIFGLISFAGIPVDIGTMMTAAIAMGIGVDGTLHKLTWFKKGIADGKTREDSIALAVGHSGPAIWETSAVLALGMLMLYPSELLLVSRFGWLMAAIIAVAVAGDIVFLPALLGGTLGTILMKGVKRRQEVEQAKAAPSVVPQPHLATSNVASPR